MIIGLTGKKQSGKSTAAKYLTDTYGAVKINFKDGLIAEIVERFPNLLNAIKQTLEAKNWDGKEWTTERLFNEKPPLVRTLMQNYGTEVRRRDDPYYWVHRWATEVTRLDGKRTVVVDDVRFENEAQAVRDAGGIIVRIERPDMVSSDTHISEKEMDSIEVNHTIRVNTGDFDSLYKELSLITSKPAEDE